MKTYRDMTQRVTRVATQITTQVKDLWFWALTLQAAVALIPGLRPEPEV